MFHLKEDGSQQGHLQDPTESQIEATAGGAAHQGQAQVSRALVTLDYTLNLEVERGENGSSVPGSI